MNSHISKLRKFFIDQCSKIDKEIICRKRLIDTKQLFSYLFRNVSNKLNSSVITLSDLKCDHVTNVSKQAIEKKLDILDSDLLHDLFISLQSHIKSTNIFATKNVYAVDGTKLSLRKATEGFHLTKNRKYKKALLNTLYSVNNKVPIDFDLSNGFDEIGSFLENLLKCVKKDDIVIFDRGYYSKELITRINNNKSHFICRMKENSLLLKNTLTELTYDGIEDLNGYGKIRIIKYTIDNSSFYLSTNIFDTDIGVEFFKELYHTRWYIEEFFKTIKHDITLQYINYTKINRIKQNINMHFIIVLLTRYLEKISIKYVKKPREDYKINHKNAIHLTGTRIIIKLLFKKSNNKIVEILGILNNETVYNKPDRHFDRVRITPPSKWYYIYKTET